MGDQNRSASRLRSELLEKDTIDMMTKFSDLYVSRKTSDSSPRKQFAKRLENNEKKSSTPSSSENNSNIEKCAKIRKKNATTGFSNRKIPLKHHVPPHVPKPKPGDVWNVYVTQMESIDHFYVQNEKHTDYIETICSALEADRNDSTPASSRPLQKVGSMVAARFVDGRWYRAKVKRIKDRGSMVCFVDFGNDEVPATDFKSLPTEFVNVNPMAYKCHFKDLPKTVENTMRDPHMFGIFKRYFVHNYETTVTFQSKTESYAVSVSYDGKNMLDVLYELIGDGILPGFGDPINDAKRTVLRECSSRELTVVRVEPVVSVEHFYVETALSQTAGVTVRHAIRTSKRNVLVRPEGGDIVVARHPNLGTLHRARVVFRYGDSGVYRCFIIDLGTFEDCSTFFEACDVLRTAFPVKIHCSLDGFRTLGDRWLDYVNVGFIDELKHTAFADGSTKLDVVTSDGSYGNTVDLVTDGLKMSAVLKPRHVKVTKVINHDILMVRSCTRGEGKIANVLNSTTKYRTIDDARLFGLYVAKCDDDPRYKRVKYIGQKGSKFVVSLVDELHRMEVVRTLYELPKSIRNVKSIDFYVTLGLNKRYHCLKKFTDICNNGETKFSMIVLKNDALDGHHVKLFLGSDDVTTKICNN